VRRRRLISCRGFRGVPFMNEEQKVKIYTAKLPIKTKVAVCWTFVLGIVVVIVPLLSFRLFSDYGERDMMFLPLLGITLCIAFLFSLSGIFLMIRKLWAWNTAVVVLITELCLLFIYLHVEINLDTFGGPILFIANILLLVPFILVIFDRKNYFAMVRQRELAKNKDTTPTVEP
jgi:hypothetical protein